MTAEEFSSVAVQLARVTRFIYYHVMGEPLTHPKLGELVRISNSLGLKSVITTNGSLLAKKGEELIASGVYKVNISVHSFEDKEKESFQQYVYECLDFADKASKNGVLVILRLWNKGHDGGRNGDILNLLKERFADGEWKEDARGARIRHKLHLEYGDRFSWPDMSADEGSSDVFCYALRDHLAVLCDGTVVPCCLDRNGELALGNIFSQSIEDILSSDRAKSILCGFDNRKAVEELCRKCGYARRFK